MKKIFTKATLCIGLLAGLQLNAQNYNISFAAQLPYPGKTLANICGYAANGNEYALVGAEDGMSIVDVTVPANPTQIVQIPNVTNLWKEIKVYRNWAYVTTEGGGGLQIVDLTNLPNTNLAYQNYTGDGAIAGQLNTIHALHIDTTKKFIYLYGSNLFNGGAVVLDINNDPYNPTFAGYYENTQPNMAYVHDGYVDNDTLYASHIYKGQFSVVDMTNKSAPVILAQQQTPTAFTHNTWLSNDHKFVFTTDENSGSFLTAYDISNLNNITETDRIQTTPGSGSVVHNTHILNNWAVTSWYRDGITIVDVTRPNNLVEVGRYDTYAGSGNGFDGAWGVYPFLPSGTLVVSNINEGLFVLTPTYVRACYLEGSVTDSACGTPLNNVTVTISSVNVTDSTNLTGAFATGTAFPGTYDVTFSKPGYNSKTFYNVTFTPAQIVNMTVQLYSPTSLSVNGAVTDASTTAGLPGVGVEMSGSSTYNFTTDGSGTFNSCSVVAGTYTVTTGAWGYETVCNSMSVNTGNPTVNVALNKQYYDDFTFDLGWTVNSTAVSGFWERGVPVLTTNNGTPSNPGNDVATDCSDKAYVTGNAGGTAGQDDIDGGSTTLTSPVFDLSSHLNPWIHYDRWFYNGGGSGNPNDTLKVLLSNGTQTVVIESVVPATPGNSTWKHSAKQVSQYLTPTATMQLMVRAADYAPGHLVEAGFDKFLVADSLPTGLHEQITETFSLSAYPNPFTSEIRIEWNLKDQSTANTALMLYDVTGRVVRTFGLNAAQGSVVLEEKIKEGVYFIRIKNADNYSRAMRIVKM